MADLHFHRLALPAPGDRRALQALVGDRASMPLDRTRPLWEVCLVDGYAAGCAVLVRMHDAIADGVALAQVMLTLTDEDGACPELGFADGGADRGSRVGSALRLAGARGARPAEVHALVPFNLRPLDEPLPKELGNRFGLVVLALPMEIESPVLRVAEVKRRMDAIKDSHEGAISYGILELMRRTPASVEARLIDYFFAKASMVLTNVPGPKARLSVAGTPLSGVLVWAPCSGSIGMSVSVFSYAGRVTVGFLTDAAVVGDPDVLAAGFRADLLACARAAR